MATAEQLGIGSSGGGRRRRRKPAPETVAPSSIASILGGGGAAASSAAASGPSKGSARRASAASSSYAAQSPAPTPTRPSPRTAKPSDILSDLLGTTYQGLEPAQARVANTILSVGLKQGAPAKHLLAAIQTGLVESNLTEIAGGDADSQNWRQERALGYADDWAKTGGPLNTVASAKRFFQEAAELDRGQSAGELAADVQRPAEEYRYKYADPEYTGLAPKVVGRFVNRVEKAGGKVPKGKLTAGPKKPIGVTELFYDPGTNLADGQPTSAIGGHGTHVHFASENPKDVLRAAKIVKRKGGSFSENPLFDPVDPVHTEGSHHYQVQKLPKKLVPMAQRLGGKGREIGEALDIQGTPEELMAINQAIARRAGAAPTSGAGASIYDSLGGGAGFAATGTSGDTATQQRSQDRSRSGGGASGLRYPFAARAPQPSLPGEEADEEEVPPDDIFSILRSRTGFRPKKRRG